VWRMSPPAPGPHVGRLGWLVSPSTWLHVAPLSVLLKRPAGSTPAKIVPSGPTARLHTVVIASAPSPYVRPAEECVQLVPPSSDRHTAGPYQALPAAARIAPEPGSTMRSWVGQPSHSGPFTDQSRRSASLSRMNAPFLVPTSNW